MTFHWLFKPIQCLTTHAIQKNTFTTLSQCICILQACILSKPKQYDNKMQVLL